jgi:hypothetical protein
MPRYREILDIAKVTINTPEEIEGEGCCFTGGMTRKLYMARGAEKPSVKGVLLWRLRETHIYPHVR